MSGRGSALLVIDVQESFRHRPYWTAEDVPKVLERIQALIDGAVRRGIAVVQIFHVEDEGPFSLASGHVEAMDPLSIMPRRSSTSVATARSSGPASIPGLSRAASAV